MKFTLEIDCDNAAFIGEDGEGTLARNYEVARILSNVATRLKGGIAGEAIILCDINGNKVGHCDFFATD